MRRCRCGSPTHDAVTAGLVLLTRSECPPQSWIASQAAPSLLLSRFRPVSTLSSSLHHHSTSGEPIFTLHPGLRLACLFPPN